MAYIRLGPRGKYFASKKYNIYLTPGVATVAKDSLLYSDLAKFIITGYFVEINKNEYENIKLNQNNNPAVNSVPKGINTINIIEPVADILQLPPLVARQGDRYIVGENPGTIWAGLSDMIVEFNGLNWSTVKPYNGLIMPLTERGIAATYVGTYPSGEWVFNPKDEEYYIDQIIGDDDDETPPGYDGDLTDLLDALNKEIEDRTQGDRDLLNLINDSLNSAVRPTAAEVRFDNTGSYISLGPNVQVAIQSLYDSNLVNQNNINILVNRVNLLEQAIANLGGGSGGANKLTSYYLYIGVTSISLNHNAGFFPHVDILEVLDLTSTQNAFPNLDSIPFRPVLAKPYQLTANNVAIELPQSKDVLVVVTKKS